MMSIRGESRQEKNYFLHLTLDYPWNDFFSFSDRKRMTLKSLNKKEPRKVIENCRNQQIFQQTISNAIHYIIKLSYFIFFLKNHSINNFR